MRFFLIIFFIVGCVSASIKKERLDCQKLERVSKQKHNNYFQILNYSLTKKDLQKHLKAQNTGYHHHFSALSMKRRQELKKIKEVFKENPNKKNRISYLKKKGEFLEAEALSGQSSVKGIPVANKALNESIVALTNHWCLCEMTKKEKKQIPYCSWALKRFSQKSK